MMLPYYLVFIVLLLMAISESRFNLEINLNQRNKKLFWSVFLLIFAFVILRGNGDGDYFSYKEYCQEIKTLTDIFNSSFPMEIGFRILSYIVNLFHLNPQFIIIFMNSISLTLIFIFIRKYSTLPYLSLLVYLPSLLQYDMHATRTAVAYSILTLTYHYFIGDNIKVRDSKIVLIILLASLFHKSALIFLLVLMLQKIPFKKMIYVISLLGSFIFVLFFNIDQIILSIFKILILTSFYARYYQYAYVDVSGYPFKLYDPRLLILVFLFVLGIAFFQWTKKEELCLKILWLNIIIMILFSQHTVFVTRFSTFFNVFILIYIPILINKIRMQYGNKLKLYFCYFITFSYSIYGIGIIMKSVVYKLFF